MIMEGIKVYSVELATKEGSFQKLLSWDFLLIGRKDMAPEFAFMESNPKFCLL